jgi:hypothetical protein
MSEAASTTACVIDAEIIRPFSKSRALWYHQPPRS